MQCYVELFSPRLLLIPFQKLTSIKIQNDKMRTGNLPANMKKNRVLQIIPCECSACSNDSSFRAFLTSNGTLYSLD